MNTDLLFPPDWAQAADDAIALLRREADRYPYDSRLTALVGELCTRSDEFRVRWAAGTVRPSPGKPRRFSHPVAGEVELRRDIFDLATDPELSLLVYSAVPGSASAAALSWLIPVPAAAGGA